MLRTLRAFTMLAAFAVCAAQAAPARVEYTLTPELTHGAMTALRVEIAFRGDADGTTDLKLPDEWGGQHELWRGIDALQVEGVTSVAEDTPAARVLTHRPNAPIRVRYRVIQDWQGPPTATGANPYRPVVQPAYFHIIGNAALILPGLDEATPARVRVRNLPRGWTFASDLEHDGLRLADVDGSVSVGGDFRVLTSHDGKTRLAIRGQWSFTDQAMLDELAAIIAAQNAFWGDQPRQYLVTTIQLTALDPGMRSIGGTGLSDAFAFFATPNAEAHRITRTLAHEGLHSWIPRRIGGMPVRDEALNYWLSEGFTDFYTARVLARQGVWGPAEFADDLNAALSDYARSPARTANNARILADFWRDRDVQRLPYQRGRLLATIWDARLRAAGGGRDFDDIMFDMRARARVDSRPAAALFTLSAEAAGLALGEDLQTYVEQGAPVLLPADAFEPCGRIVTRDVPNFHRGFDIVATQANNNVIAGVDPALPAYAAGLRDGMVLVRRDGGEIGNAEAEIAYVVRVDDAERTIRYMPRGRGSFMLQKLELHAPLEGEQLARCRAVLAGS